MRACRCMDRLLVAWMNLINRLWLERADEAARRPLRAVGARTSVLVALLVALVLLAGGTVLVQVTGEMRKEADGRLDGHSAGLISSVDAIIQGASSDIRLARRNVTFANALADSAGQLLSADQTAVDEAITYLGDRQQVDEICLIRASGLEAARWVNGKGVAAVSDLSPDERQNNPAVLPTLPLADDAFYQTAPYVSPDSDRWVVGIATPIILASGGHAGVLHLEIPIDRFAATMNASPFGGTSYSALLDRDGRLLVHPKLAEFRGGAGSSTDSSTGPFPSAKAFGSASWRAAVSTITSGATGSTTFDDGGQSFRVSFAPVPDSDRIVAVISPMSELYADIDRILLDLLVTAGPLLILMIGVTGWFARRMAQAKGGLEGLNQRLALTNADLEQASRASGDLARESSIVNQFTELTALTEEESSLADASLATLDELVHPDNASLHVSNPSQDRAVPQATLGDHGAEILSLHELGQCPAVRRSSLYVTDDVASRLSFHCPVYRVTSGTLACVPLVALGETIGSIHLHWSETRHLSLPARLAITRVGEHSALSIANRRLLLALRGQANTDGRTGLKNSRAFDEVVQKRLSIRGKDDPAAVLMLDLDHFKDFNDRYGHAAGDEALRAFASLLSTSIRDQDVAARYGGEEFAIFLAGLGEREAAEVAERIRERTEAMIMPLGPGQTGRLTVSIGIAVVPEEGTERVALLKAADEALYRAKLEGRNRVVSRASSAVPAPKPADRSGPRPSEAA